MDVENLHDFRKQIDMCISRAEHDMEETQQPYDREMAIARTKLQEAKMWVGKCLEHMDEPLPDGYRQDKG